jgi:hypothetical protein
LRLYRHAIVVPLSVLPLRRFLAQAQTVLLAGGFAWGSGAFLTLAPTTGLPVLLLFSVGMAAILGAILRDVVGSLYFLVPAVFLPSAATLMRPLVEPVLAALLVSVLGLAVAAVIVLAAKRPAQASAPAPLAKLS